MTIQVALMLMGLIPHNPLAAFEANFHRCLVSVDYRYETSTASPRIVGRLRRGEPIEIESTPRVLSVGEWAFDGETEFFDIGAPDEEYVPRAVRSTDGRFQRFNAPRREFLSDRTTTAALEFSIEGVAISARNPRPGQGGASAFNPFYWNGSSGRLTLELVRNYPVFEPIRSRIFRNGRMLEVEVYDRFPDSHSRERLEIDYDPEANFLPRYARSITTTPRETFVCEYFLIRTGAAPGGGVLPMEWFQAVYRAPEALRPANEYEVETEIGPSAAVWINHLTVTQVRPQSAPVAMRRLEGVNALSLPRGRVPFNPNAAPVTMARIREEAGAKLERPDLDRSAPLDPTFADRPFGGVPEDFPSWEAYLNPPGKSLGWVVYLLAAPVVVAALAAVRWRRSLKADRRARANEPPPPVSRTAAARRSQSWGSRALETENDVD